MRQLILYIFIYNGLRENHFWKIDSVNRNKTFATHKPGLWMGFESSGPSFRCEFVWKFLILISPNAVNFFFRMMYNYFAYFSKIINVYYISSIRKRKREKQKKLSKGNKFMMKTIYPWTKKNSFFFIIFLLLFGIKA